MRLIHHLLAELAEARTALASMGEWPFEGEPDVWADIEPSDGRTSAVA